jgi:hypothetical protein
MNEQRADPSGKAAEYLEKLVGDGFKREMDQEENVVRSLPFFATSIGVLVAFISLARPALPPASDDPMTIVAYVLLGGVVACLAGLLGFLFMAVRHRTYTYPMNEAALIKFTGELTAYYSSALPSVIGVDADDAADDTVGNRVDPDLARDAVEKAVVADLRRELTNQLAAAAMTSRENNAKRLRARSRAFAALILALSLALALIVVILAIEAPNGGSNAQGRAVGRDAADRNVPGHKDRQNSGETQGPSDEGGGERLRNIPGDQPDGSVLQEGSRGEGTLTKP